ncbi:GH39 family glycosyl hydrolase [Sodalis sp. RH20]|uniref:GH39 family glycosyl hydrolase n=1 Tax=unclassified Sodalis (in: enterobacteria) TaxID=2636512 RepID=UPI0039B4D94A
MPIKKWLSISLFASLMCTTILSHSAELFLRDASGVNYIPPDGQAKKMGIGWVRMDLSWSNIEKEKGTYNWAKFDTFVTQANKQGLQVLPVLAYTPAWTQSISRKISSPPNDYDAWLKFVDAAVTRYSNPSYGIKFFQIWNEPTIKASYWLGSTNDFIDKIYIPAAKIIRGKNAKVVFGGWPLSNPIHEFKNALNHNDAWKYTDIIDFHYGTDKEFQYLYDNFIQNKKVYGIWQTEFGFRTTPLFLSKNYIRMLDWALKHDMSDNRYKVFWYPAWATGKDGGKALFTVNSNKQNVLTSHGQELTALYQVFGDNKIKLSENYPVDNLSRSNSGHNKASLFAFSVGENKQIIIPFINDNTVNDKKFSFKMPYKGAINSLTVMTALGDKLDSSFKLTGTELVVNVANYNPQQICQVCTKDKPVFIIIN